MTIHIIGSDHMKKYVFVKQQGYKDCACACMLMLIKYYNGSVSLEYLREITNTTTSGTSLYHLVDAAKKIGFNAYGLKGSIESLESSLLPVIAHGIVQEKYKHFIVIYTIDTKRKKLLIADPAEGIKKISFDQFKQFSTGYYCIFELLKPLPKLKETKFFSHFVFHSVLKNKSRFLSCLFLSFSFLILSIITCYYIQFIIDYAIQYHSIYNLLLISGLFFFLFLLKTFFGFLKDKISIHLSTSLEETLTTNTFNHILSLPYFYYKNHPSGEILARMQDIQEISRLVSKTVLDIAIYSLLILMTCFILFLLDKVFILILLFMIIIYILVFYITNITIHSLDKQLHKQAGRLNHFILESFGLVQTIKNLDLGGKFKNRFHLFYKRFLIKKEILSNQYNQLNLMNELLNTTGFVLFVFTAAFLILKKNASLGLLLTYQQIFSYFNDSFPALLSSVLELRSSKISFERLMELYNIEEEENKKKVKQNIKGNIQIQDLTFSFGKKKILEHVYLNIEPGEKILLFGPSGAGKSTLVRMLLRLIEIERNKIFIDGIDICEFDIHSLRDNICYLSQNEILLTDSIYNNITLFRNVGYEDFLKVAKISLLDQMVEEKKVNYDTLLEENGFNLSGGERQRILLARTLLKKANVYIFDESLSEIDIESERKILKKLFFLYRDKTIIVISHRFENSQLFDQKIKIEKGVCNYE